MMDEKQQEGFVRAMARELLVHNQKVHTVDDAIWMAQELLSKTGISGSDLSQLEIENPTHTHDGIENVGRMDNS